MKPLHSALTALALTAALSASALAAPTSFVPDPNHTFVRFSYNHLGFTTQQSRFDKTTGTVTLDPAAKSASIDLVIDTKSVDTGSELFNGHIQGVDFLDTADFRPPHSNRPQSSSMATRRSASMACSRSRASPSR